MNNREFERLYAATHAAFIANGGTVGPANVYEFRDGHLYHVTSAGELEPTCPPPGHSGEHAPELPAGTKAR